MGAGPMKEFMGQGTIIPLKIAHHVHCLIAALILRLIESVQGWSVARCTSLDIKDISS